MFKAIVFDLDGTLLDTIQDLANSMNSVLSTYGYPTHPVEKYNYFVGNGMVNLVKGALPQEVVANESDLTKYIEAYREEYNKRWDDTTRAYEGVPELLDGLTKRGIKMTILSNKPDKFTHLTVTKLLPNWKFDIIYGERPSVPRKPDPAGALEIAEILNIPVKEFLYLGDSGVDMETANAAGMYAVGALWGLRGADELLASGARTLIVKPAELIKLL